MKNFIRTAAFAALLLLPMGFVPAYAQQHQGMDHSMHAAPATPEKAKTARPGCACCKTGKCPLKNHEGQNHEGQNHQGHGTHAANKAETGYDAEMETAMAKMHEAMAAVKPTGNPDVDFMRGMLPHHEGAVDMALILRKYGRDPETRELATNIIRAQQSEIHLMKRWLVKRGFAEYNN